MSRVRPFVPSDVPRVAELHESVFAESSRHSRRRELIDAVRCGDAVVTRLDGEWWMCFLDGLS